jgi:octanoyl-[GcvH]:protein N-octanoyltransferase
MSHEGHRTLTVTREGFSEPAWLDTAVSRVLLEHTAAGEEQETLRLYRPAPVLAFGPADRLSPGYEDAREAAVRAGFAPVERLAGGRAAVFHEHTIAFAWTVHDPQARTHIHARFEAISLIISETLRRLAVDARVGQVAGEYCPGAYSVNAAGQRKLMGVGQRVLPRAAHVGGVIVVDGASRVREVLVPVYEALGLAWDPSTVGSIRDEIGAVGWEDVTRMLLDVLSECFEIREGQLAPAIIEQARELGPQFRAPRSATAARHDG